MGPHMCFCSCVSQRASLLSLLHACFASALVGSAWNVSVRPVLCGSDGVTRFKTQWSLLDPQCLLAAVVWATLTQPSRPLNLPRLSIRWTLQSWILASARMNVSAPFPVFVQCSVGLSSSGIFNAEKRPSWSRKRKAVPSFVALGVRMRVLGVAPLDFHVAACGYHRWLQCPSHGSVSVGAPLRSKMLLRSPLGMLNWYVKKYLPAAFSSASPRLCGKP